MILLPLNNYSLLVSLKNARKLGQGLEVTFCTYYLDSIPIRRLWHSTLIPQRLLPFSSWTEKPVRAINSDSREDGRRSSEEPRSKIGHSWGRNQSTGWFRGACPQIGKGKNLFGVQSSVNICGKIGVEMKCTLVIPYNLFTQIGVRVTFKEKKPCILCFLHTALASNHPLSEIRILPGYEFAVWVPCAAGENEIKSPNPQKRSPFIWLSRKPQSTGEEDENGTCAVATHWGNEDCGPSPAI